MIAPNLGHLIRATHLFLSWFLCQKDQYSAILSADKFQQEPEKIKKWREEQKARLAQKDAEEEQKKKELKENAKKELEDWYKNRTEQLAKTHANNKLVLGAFQSDLSTSSTASQNGGIVISGRLSIIHFFIISLSNNILIRY